DGQSVEVAFILKVDNTFNRSNWCTVLRNTCLKQLLNTRQTAGNIATDTTLVEGTHGQLRTRLTNGLCSNNTDSLSDINLLAGSHGLAVALSTNTGWGLAGKYGTNLDV